MTSTPVAKLAPAESSPRPPANYLDFYGLAKPPFGGAAEHAGYILFSSHTRAFELLVDHLVNGHGAIVLQGDAGIGKTETLLAAASVARESGARIITISRPSAGRITLCQLVSALTDDPNADETKADDAIGHFFEAPRKALLADDFDLMPADCLDLLLKLAQRASSEQGGSVVVLAHSTDLMADAKPPQLSHLLNLARNTIRLPRLTLAEIRQFIERSLWTAGGTTRRLIATDAMKLIIARSGGLPGTTNRLMEAVLAAGFARGDAMITAKTVTATIGPAPSRQHRADDPSGVSARAMQLIAAALLVSGASLFLYKGFQSDLDRPALDSPKPLTAPAPPSRSVPPSPSFSQPSAPSPSRPPSLLPPREQAAPARAPAMLSPNLMALLMKRGNQSLELGDIAAARLLFGRAAEAGNASAATALGKTYDPVYAASGQSSDPTRAAEWYHKAVTLGDAQATTLLKQLNGR